jgi:UDPglucose--hexose-1-phosphate uridylyltransferase
MGNMKLPDGPHRRYNPLTDEWVLVSPHRAKRPWLGQVEKIAPEFLPNYDPACYLCPGNQRAGGIRNTDYQGVFVFDNDFPALLELDQKTEPLLGRNRSGLFYAETASGICRVVCFSPRHDLTVPEMTRKEIEAVIHAWAEQTVDLGNRDFIRYVQIFENKGAVMGCSNPHPHSQIWATSFIPNEPAKELASLKRYYSKNRSCLFCDLIATEQIAQQRLVCANAHFSALVPFWAIWPFEILVIAHRHAASLPDLSEEEMSALADIFRRVTTRYDNLFQISFPYSMGFHQAPTDDQKYPECHLHMHFYPPLLRSATVRKFMVGFEMLGMPQRDLTPESAAERMRELNENHYKVVM